MLAAHGVAIGASAVATSALPQKTGRQVARELGDRYLMRYLLPHQVGQFVGGSSGPHWVTPTAYAPEETISWLALPAPRDPRPYVMLLKPEEIVDIWGPRWVRFGGGIEYPWEQEVR